MLQVTRMLNNELRLKHKEGRKEGIEEGEKKGILKVARYNIPINVDTIKEGYPILCA